MYPAIIKAVKDDYSTVGGLARQQRQKVVCAPLLVIVHFINHEIMTGVCNNNSIPMFPLENEQSNQSQRDMECLHFTAESWDDPILAFRCRFGHPVHDLLSPIISTNMSDMP
jgi:hypothetical protein